jgi:hypothetical protein
VGVVVKVTTLGEPTGTPFFSSCNCAEVFAEPTLEYAMNVVENPEIPFTSATVNPKFFTRRMSDVSEVT